MADSTTYRIRLASREDLPSILEIYAPFVTSDATSFEEAVPSLDDMRERLEKISARFPWLVAVTDIQGATQIAGYAYASPHRDRASYRWAVEVSAYVHPNHRGRGVASSLYSVLFEALRRQGYRRAYAGITLPNLPSVSLHERMGFELVGIYEDIGFKFGSWHSVGWWGLSLTDSKSPPISPTLLPHEIGMEELLKSPT